jgi:hypothetical protein
MCVRNSLVEVFFLPGNGARKQLDADGVDI